MRDPQALYSEVARECEQEWVRRLAEEAQAPNSEHEQVLARLFDRWTTELDSKH